MVGGQTHTHMHTRTCTLRNPDSTFGAASDAGHRVPTAKLGIKESVSQAGEPG